MDPSCSNLTREDRTEKILVSSDSDTKCKTDKNAIENGPITCSKSEQNRNQEHIDDIEREDFEEENRLIKHCSEIIVEVQKISATSFAETSGASPSEEMKINLPGCSSSDDCDSNTTIKNMLQPLPKNIASLMKNGGDKSRHKSLWSSMNNSSHQKCSHRCERDGTINKADKDSQTPKDHKDSQLSNLKTLEILALLEKTKSSTPKFEDVIADRKDDARNYFQDYYGSEADTDDDENENTGCTCMSSAGEDDSEVEKTKNYSDEVNRSWRKRHYDSASATPCKKICPEASTSSAYVENSWLSSNMINKGLDNQPELNQWIHRFTSWSNSEQIQAIDALIIRSAPCQVRHMMNAIEPLFQRDFISLLPKELALTVLRHLEPESLARAAQTCRYWRFLAEDNLLWREQCQKVGITSLTRLDRISSFSTSPWKAAFVRQYMIETNWATKPVNHPIVMKGHDDHVITCLQFYGDRIVSGSDDTTLKVWSAITGRCLKTLVGHTGGVWSSQMFDNLVISGSTDRTLRVWNAKTGQCLKVLSGHTSTVRCMHLHKDRVVSGSRDATLRIWSVPEGRCLRVLVGHLAAVRCVQYDGKVVVSGAYDYFIKLWNPVTGECLHTLAGHANRVYSLQFDGIHVVSGSLDTSIRVWDAESGQLKHTLIGHQSLTSGMELQSNILVSGNADSTVKVWDISTGHCLHTLSGPNKHQSAVTCLQSTKRFVITSSDDGTVKLWDMRTGEFIRNLVELDSGGSGGVVWRIRASATKLICAVGSRNGTEETKLLVLNFDVPMTCRKCSQ